MKSRLAWLPPLLVSTFAGALLLQYPLSATFPIGGDASRYILRATEITSASSLIAGVRTLATNSVYPAATLSVVLSRALPIEWPLRWILLMTFAHLAVAAALFIVVKNISRSALTGSLAAAAWAIVGTAFTRHIQDGTLAQLLSLSVLVLCLGQLLRRKFLSASLWGIVSFLFHPLSGVVAALLTVSYVLTNSHIFLRTPQRRIAGLALLLLGGSAGAFFYTKNAYFFTRDLVGADGASLSDLMQGSFGPLTLVALLGAPVFVQRYGRQSHALLLTATAAGLLIFQNQLFGESVLFWRGTSYAALCIAFFAAFGLAELLANVPPPRWALSAAGAMLLVSLGLKVWSAQAVEYRFYENAGNYARLHQDERAAIDWLRQHTPRNAVIVSSRANRHSEWIPILGERAWHGLAPDDPFVTDEVATLKTHSATQGYTYAVVFRHRESIRDVLPSDVPARAIVFENKGAFVVDLSLL